MNHFGELLRLEHLETPEGVAVIEVDIRQELCNRYGSVHGGVLTTLMDVAGLWAGAKPKSLPRASTVSLACSFMAPAMLAETPRLRARAEIVKRGRSMYFCSILVTSIREGAVLAMGQGAFRWISAP